MISIIIQILGPIIVGYLVGALPFSFIIARLWGVSDIRKTGSGNAGMTNVWRTIGAVPALIVFVLDVGKGALVVWWVSTLLLAIDHEIVMLTAGISAIFGHMFPVYLHFKGGKGVNTALGVMLVLLPVDSLIAFAIFLLVVAVSKYISLGSISAAIAFAVSVIVRYLSTNWEVHPIFVPAAVLLALIIIIAHRSNIKRLAEGNENRFRFSKSTDREVEENA